MNANNRACSFLSLLQAKETSLNLRGQFNHYITFRSHLTPVAETASLTLEVLHQCSPHHTTNVSFTRLQRHLVSALRGSDEPDGGGGREVEAALGSLANALQATAEVLNTSAEDEAEREERESKWRDGVLHNLMVAAVKDLAWSAFTHYMNCL